MPALAPNAETMSRSGIRRIMDLAWSLPGPIIGLHVGEPSFAAPAHVVEAARAAYAAGETHYVPNAGMPQLRTALAEKVTNRNGFAVEPEQIIVSAGGAQALHLAFSLTLAAGSEVLVPDPGWPNFAMTVHLLQGVAVGYPLQVEHDFRPRVEDLEKLVTERTTAILINSPSNPLGTVLPAEDIQALVEFANRHDLWVISDECYDGLAFDTENVSPGRFDTQGRVLTAYSFSKTYAMTGLRVGYLVVPPAVVANAAKLQEPMIACVNAPAQLAALAALTGPQDEAEEMRAVYQRNRDLCIEQLTASGRVFVRPEGTFFLWIDVRDLSQGDVEAWAMRLLREHGVAVAPGTVFGPRGEGWIRISLATTTSDLLEGLRRIEAAVPQTASRS